MAGADDTPGAALAGLYDRPVLVLDPGMHTAPIQRIAVDAGERYLATASHDKTVRVWSLDDGRLLRTLRVPTGAGNLGKLYAVALSPDGSTVAAGGWTDNRAGEVNIYLFDRASGRLERRISGLPNVVAHLAYSGDGRHLAAALWGANGVRVYRAGDGDEVFADRDYGAGSYGAAFDRSGRLVTTSEDGYVRLYDRDFRLIAKESLPDEAEPFGAAFSPDGRRLAVCSYDSTRVDVLSGETLKPLFAPDTAGVASGSLSQAAWSADGRFLYAGGQYPISGRSLVRRWADAGRGDVAEFPVSSNTIVGLLPLTGGGLAFAAQDPALGVLDAAGRVLWERRPDIADFRGQEGVFAVSADGAAVRFGYEPFGKRPARFSVAERRLDTEPPAETGLALARTEAPGLTITGWKNTYTPELNGQPLALDSYETSRNLAIAPDGQRFLLGTEWSLRLFDCKGKERWRVDVPGVACAVNVSGDGRLAVAAYADGTIRWHRMDDGRELLALLPLADRANWVAWTPEGYYASSPGTGSMLGWHVNRGWDKPADFYPITAYAGFYQRAALPLVLQELETARALGIAKIAHDRKLVQEAVDSPVPPGPQLHVLAVGISDYAHHKHLTLDFADDDARDIANALLAHEGGLYAKVNVQYLPDARATRREFLAAIRRIYGAMQPDQRDVAVIHFSGHGAEAGDAYYLLPYEVEATSPIDIMTTGIEVRQLKDLLRGLGERGKVLVLLDACHSGNVLSDARGGLPPDVETVRAELAAAGSGVIVLTSSSGKEVSKENPDWQNGAFTEAVLEALAGKADRDGDGWLSVSELEGYVVRRVRELTGNQQNPRIAVLGEHHFEARLFVAGL